MPNNNSAGDIVLKSIVILLVTAVMLTFIGGVLLQWLFTIPAVAMITFLGKICRRKP